MRTKFAILAVVLVGASAAFGASAFTSSTIDRSATMNVVSDSNGLIALEDGTSGTLINENSSGALSINLANETAGAGANIDSRYEFGDETDPGNSSAFNITNNGGESYTVNLDYTLTTNDGDNTTENVKFLVFRSGSTTADATVTEETAAQSLSLASGETVNVVLIIDTNTGVSTGDDLSGTLSVTV
ncbi:hypothetical protein [Haloplanus halobius]|uniref:hypothetical protein n=1 Tax=Haloplanus halobius TaxID=2934938 RepID=UPI00200BF90D|nr:hypothetical protein [Haloplanus sp. XH21]